MQARLKLLAHCLDGLVMAYHETTEVEAQETYQDTPPHDHAAIYKRMGKTFPTLGYYADVEPICDLKQDATVADAVDDLADIYKDMADVVWYAENVGLNEATWHYRFGYQFHWGTHLHSIRRYLASSDIAAW